MWGKLLVGGLAGYTAYRVAQNAHEQRQLTAQTQMDNAIDELLALPREDAVRAMIDLVPQLDNAVWSLLAARFEHKAIYDAQARVLLSLGQALRQATHEVDQLLGQSITDAVGILVAALPRKGQMEQLAFLGALQARAQTNIKAQAIMGRLRNAIER